MSLRDLETAPSTEGIAREARRLLLLLRPEERGALETSLRDDMVTEYDARFLVDYLESLDVAFSPAFRENLQRWYRDEVRHFGSFRGIFEACFGDAAPLLAARRPDFAEVEHLFGGEFEILCLLAYDELATLRGYRGNLPLYDRLGGGLGAFVRRVIGDEAGHYAGFRALLIENHADRLGEVDRVVERIRAAEGAPYRATFVLDHDDPVYGDHIFDDAARVLTTQIQRERTRLGA